MTAMTFSNRVAAGPVAAIDAFPAAPERDADARAHVAHDGGCGSIR